VLALTDAYTDVTGNFTATGSSLAGSAVYDPLGNVASSATMAGRLGYQSAWTDPATTQVHMGARWYDPATGQFTSRDTTQVSPAPDPQAANPFAYAAGNPMTGTDPTGHMLVAGTDGGYWGSHYVAPPPPRPRPPAPRPSCSWLCGLSHAYHATVHATVHAAVHVYHAVQVVVRTAEDVDDPWFDAKSMLAALADARQLAGHIAQGLKTAVADATAPFTPLISQTWHAVKAATAAVSHTVTRTAEENFDAAVHMVHTAVHDVAKAASATTNFIKNHAAAIGGVVASIAVFAGCEAAIGIITAGAGSVVGEPLCGALSGAVGNAVSYGITAAQTGKFSWAALGKTTLTGAIVGGLTGGIFGGAGGEIGDAATDALADGATNDTATAAADSAATGAANDTAAATSDTADTTADDDALSCNANSFTGKTKVLLASGATVAISKVKAGDKVEATDPYQHVTAARPVVKVVRHHRWHAMAAIVLVTGAIIQATSQHPIWDATTRAFTYAADLRPGDQLLEPDGATVAVQAVRHYQADLTAYNLDVSAEGRRGRRRQWRHFHLPDVSCRTWDKRT
jgi:RHS repeat-associated protein